VEPPTAEGDAVLVIRVWCEPDHHNRFRARVLGLRPDDRSGTVLSSPDAVADAVRGWLAGFWKG
jgi:hypothetical protein